MRVIMGSIASICSFVAGVYLLSTQAAQEDSLIEVLMHGVGIYFIGKAFYLGPALHALVVNRTKSEEAQAD